MNQTKIDSILEALTNIAIGAGVALLAQIVWFPIIGKSFTMLENLQTTAFFTLISFARSYFVRRWFNGRSVYQVIKSKINRLFVDLLLTKASITTIINTEIEETTEETQNENITNRQQ